MGTTRPVSVRAALNSSMIRARSLLLDPGGIRSSSWKVMPYAPSSASLCTASTAARTGRVASPNRSRACQPTVHRPKLNLSSRVGCGAIGASGEVVSSLAEAGGQAGEELAAADRVQNEDRQRGQNDGRENRRHVDAVLALEGPQGQRQGPLLGALGQDQRQQEAVPDAQAVVDGHG